jgi:hypothetical protein
MVNFDIQIFERKERQPVTSATHTSPAAVVFFLSLPKERKNWLYD